MVGIKKPAVGTAASMAVRRVVTCFILTNPSNRVAIFHRCDTMPSFPSYWAGISGTIEKAIEISKDVDEQQQQQQQQQQYETPYQAAKRELGEETNLFSELEDVVIEDQGGLYLDVPVPKRSGDQQKRIVRVYPFAVHISDEDVHRFEMRGTEHDDYKFVPFDDLTRMESQCVPGLVQAFHHATYGKFNPEISDAVRRWSEDKENGASVMTQNAIQLVANSNNNENGSCDDGRGDESTTVISTTTARHIAMLRPSMVPIVNVMNRIVADHGKESVTMESFLDEMDRCVTLGQTSIHNLLLQKSKTGGGSYNKNDNDKTSSSLTIATFSRSGTLVKILKPFLEDKSCTIICSQSTPGDEGELMANDLNTNWIPDQEMHKFLNSEKQDVDLLLIGSDCVLPPTSMVNKVGTKQLCEIAQRNNIPVFCCADAWKVWDDLFPPPIETDLFEFVPLNLVTKLLVPFPVTATPPI